MVRRVKAWSELTTREFASEIADTLTHAIRAHTDCASSPGDAVRKFDGKTPYAVHPLWCAMTILMECQLDSELRHIGYQALAWHDTLEDTTLALPDGVDPRVRRLVEELSFAKHEDERVLIWDR